MYILYSTIYIYVAHTTHIYIIYIYIHNILWNIALMIWREVVMCPMMTDGS